MKLRYWGLGASMLLSLAVITAVGTYQKNTILKPLDLDEGMDPVKVPFLMAVDEDLKLQIEIARELQAEMAQNSGEQEPPEMEPSETEPLETEPLETEPLETEPPETQPSETTPPETQPVETEPPETQPPETVPPETTPPETKPVETTPPATKPPETTPPATTPPATTPPETVPTETTAPPANDPSTGNSDKKVTTGTSGVFEPGNMVDESWFDDVLFIGDSRTDGLRLYARLGKADYFCSTGLSVYTVLTKKCSDKNFSEQKLETLLSSRTYGKVLIGLGINECGSSLQSYVKAYQKLIDLVREKQPGATIILQSIMTCSPKKEKQNSVFSPTNIYTRNEAIKDLADGVTIFYIDVNEVFADENGYLPTDFSSDGCHLYAKKYPLWVSWIRSAVYDIPLVNTSAE